jgi:hypothetical protein
METDSEKVLLDLRNVHQELRHDDTEWNEQWTNLKRDEWGSFPLSWKNTYFLKAWSKHLESTQRKYNSTQNGFLASSYAVRMMCRFLDFGDYYFNGPFGSIKACRSLIDNNSAAVSLYIKSWNQASLISITAIDNIHSVRRVLPSYPAGGISPCVRVPRTYQTSPVLAVHRTGIMVVRGVVDYYVVTLTEAWRCAVDDSTYGKIRGSLR